MCGKCRQSQVSIARIEVEREEEEVEGRRGWKEGERGVKNGSASITLRGYICRVIPPHFLPQACHFLLFCGHAEICQDRPVRVIVLVCKHVYREDRKRNVGCASRWCGLEILTHWHENMYATYTITESEDAQNSLGFRLLRAHWLISQCGLSNLNLRAFTHFSYQVTCTSNHT